MEIINTRKKQNKETVIDEMMFSSTQNGKELVKEYIKAQEKLERNESLSAAESIKLLELIKSTIEDYKEEISGLKKNKTGIMVANFLLKATSLFLGKEGLVYREYATAGKISLQNIFPNLERVEQTVEDTKDNLETENIVNAISAYKEVIKYSRLMDSAYSMPDQLSSDSAKNVEQLSRKLKETQEKINQLTYKPKIGGLYGFGKK